MKMKLDSLPERKALLKSNVEYEVIIVDASETPIEFVILSDAIIEYIPRGRRYLSDHLQRTALSISLNILEGVCE